MASRRVPDAGQVWRLRPRGAGVGAGPAGLSPRAQPVPVPGRWLGQHPVAACLAVPAQTLKSREGEVRGQPLTCDHSPLCPSSATRPPPRGLRRLREQRASEGVDSTSQRGFTWQPGLRPGPHQAALTWVPCGSCHRLADRANPPGAGPGPRTRPACGTFPGGTLSTRQPEAAAGKLHAGHFEGFLTLGVRWYFRGQRGGHSASPSPPTRTRTRTRTPRSLGHRPAAGRSCRALALTGPQGGPCPLGPPEG